MNTTARTLFLSPRVTATGRALAEAARRRGMRTRTLTDWRVPPELRDLPGSTLYAGPLFADAVGHDLGLGLLEADEDWLTRLPRELVGRDVEFTTVAEARRLRRPAFVKPPNDKSFPARVYPDGSGLPGPDAVDDDVPVLVSDIVAFAVEFRLFVLNGEVRAGSRYMTHGELDIAPLDDDPQRAELLDFAGRLFAPGVPALPAAVVVDRGRANRWGG
ncbi:ATP-grasp domain-containing protein [Actinacidiphila soli]|uniref:ATP-grasp domain-containing protein n=1 Tax=Actinacidiphila soli TaxID=2487275 RepID=UPI000FCA9273|nr:ATP-grasp domain-containing protein [Actinacidiphila soli]